MRKRDKNRQVSICSRNFICAEAAQVATMCSSQFELQLIGSRNIPRFPVPGILSPSRKHLAHNNSGRGALAHPLFPHKDNAKHYASPPPFSQSDKAKHCIFELLLYSVALVVHRADRLSIRPFLSSKRAIERAFYFVALHAVLLSLAPLL